MRLNGADGILAVGPGNIGVQLLLADAPAGCPEIVPVRRTPYELLACAARYLVVKWKQAAQNIEKIFLRVADATSFSRFL